MAARSCILLWVAETFSHGRDIIRGVVGFTRHRADWEVVRQPPGRFRPSRLLQSRANGAVVFLSSSAVARVFSGLGFPMVNVCASLPESPWPTVANDDFAIGCMAAEHFLERGYRNFGYVGFRRSYAPRLEAGFADTLRREGFDYQRFTHYSGRSGVGRNLEEAKPPLVRWTAGLPNSTGVFAIGNLVGSAVIRACKRARRAVPGQVAVLGVNNDDLTCEAVDPPLSSIQTSGEQIGYRAAMLLAELLKGASPPARPVWVPPLGVVARASTGALGAGDPLVAEALAFMHDHAHEPFSVDDLLISLNISRRSLERKFRKHLRRTPLQEIQRLHLRQAQHLLAQTDYPIGQAARRSGFASPQHMATRFRQAIGLTPSAYRKQYRRILTLEAEGQERVKG